MEPTPPGGVANLPDDIRTGIAEHGIRNSHLLAIAPTGTISLLAGNVSSGIEPVFAGEFERKVLNEDGTTRAFRLVDYALDLWRRRGGEAPRQFARMARCGSITPLGAPLVPDV